MELGGSQENDDWGWELYHFISCPEGALRFQGKKVKLLGVQRKG